MRKYFESQILKFEEDFYPGIEYLQGLLRKVPIQILPTWYSIPRTSNNIFDSLIEKYLITPHTYERYLSELTFSDEILTDIVRSVHQAPEYKVRADEIIKKHHLSHEQFEEHLLLLEFHFACCLRYEKKWRGVGRGCYPLSRMALIPSFFKGNRRCCDCTSRRNCPKAKRRFRFCARYDLYA